MWDDDGNKLESYRTDIYHRKVLFAYLKEAEEALGIILYEVKAFRGKGFEIGSMGAHIEGLTSEGTEVMDHLERKIHHLAVEKPKGFDRW